MFLLSKLVRDTGFKVVLTGEGADEFLAGYDIFKEDKIRRFWARQPESATRPLLMKKLYADIRSLAEGHFDFLAAFFRQGLTDVTSPWYSHAVRWRNNARTLRFFQEHVLQENKESHLERLAGILPAAFNRWEPLARAQFLESSIFLSQYLLCSQGDRMGMAHSIEGRFPFLDVRVVEFCNKLPPRLKLRCLDEKFLLKKAAQPFLPAEIRQRPKRPYRAPIHRSLCCSSTADYIGELLAPASLAASGIFRPQAVEGLLKRLRAGAVLAVC
jgi:asparagine synthase (glutamine-hydrolysing)